MKKRNYPVLTAEDRMISRMTLSFLSTPLVLLVLAGIALAA